MIPSPPAAPAPPIVSISERSMRMTSQLFPPGKKLKKPLPLVVSRSFTRQCDRIPVNAYTDQRNYPSAELRLTPINERTSSRCCPQHRPRHLRSTAPMLSGRDQPRLILASLPSSLLAPQPTRMYFWTLCASAHLRTSIYPSTRFSHCCLDRRSQFHGSGRRWRSQPMCGLPLAEWRTAQDHMESSTERQLTI